MANLILAVAALLLASATTINGGTMLSTMNQDHQKWLLPTPEEGCGISAISNTRIVGGVRAKQGAWPWMALLFYKTQNRLATFLASLFKMDDLDTFYACGGSLITSKHVLTAAHCIWDELSFVRLGEHDTSTTDDGPHEDFKIAHVEQHSEYHKGLVINDIALLYLERAVEFSDRIRPICLPITSRSIRNRRFVGLNPFLAGWGTPKESIMFGPMVLWSYESTSILMQVQVPVVANDECKRKYKKIRRFGHDYQFDDRVVCAGFTEGGKDSCQGDSGGPLMLPLADKNGSFPFYQIGIVSWGEGCGRPNIPGINTNVQYFAEWINEKVALSFD